MKTICTIAEKHLVCIIMLLTTFIISSCKDDNVGEFVLTGNIEHLIPEGTYDLKKTETSSGQYIVFMPDLDYNFEYWGLTLKQVDYYIDDELYSSETRSPWEIIINKDDMEKGNHKLRAEMKISGQACDDVVLVKEKAFYISNNSGITERHGDIYIDYNYITKGEELVITPELLTNRSTEGCEFDQVKYYWDGKLIATYTTSPYTLRYKVDDEIESTHQISVQIAYHDVFSKNLSYNWSFSNYKIHSSNDYFYSCRLKSGRNDYKNGETISLVAKLYKGSGVKKDFDIEFYLDDELIAKSSSFPYTFNYRLTNLSKGSHVLKYKFITKESNVTSIQTTENIIIITE
ncbi:Ig-like domain-containing protein [Xylanibacter muris]|uniref:Ig-like domain-containing protein n=1 Tax=Xylanibacter muris TaxID=2736290 RepID=A0ABX2AQL5_9BACT|nr:Ig-like domain-containing protein [Xylanibacter muris]NPD92837.1 Ig-like domain-containing protein [Xylanibacter muris]